MSNNSKRSAAEAEQNPDPKRMRSSSWTVSVMQIEAIGSLSLHTSPALPLETADSRSPQTTPAVPLEAVDSISLQTAPAAPLEVTDPTAVPRALIYKRSADEDDHLDPKRARFSSWTASVMQLEVINPPAAPSFKRRAGDGEHPDPKRVRFSSWTELGMQLEASDSLSLQTAPAVQLEAVDPLSPQTAPVAPVEAIDPLPVPRAHICKRRADEDDHPDPKRARWTAASMQPEAVDPPPAPRLPKRTARDDDEGTQAPKRRRPLPAWVMPAIVEGDEDAVECTICLEPIMHPSQCTELLPCEHAFHAACLARYAAMTRCPNCRRSVTRTLRPSTNASRNERRSDDDEQRQNEEEAAPAAAARNPQLELELAVLMAFFRSIGFEM